ncbi:MAG: HDOD domain-containing protein [Myxococcota bacterium]|nr:HDOD domain-containing protein [Myxococcota bacterium]
MKGPLNILVIEGGVTLCDEHLTSIGRAGHLGHAVNSLREARDRRGRLTPEVMLFSGEHWDQGGAEVIAHFAEKGKVCRVVVVGGEAVRGRQWELIDQGVQAVLLQPISTGELARVIEGVMAGPPAGVPARSEVEKAAVAKEDGAKKEALADGEIEADGEVEESPELRGHIQDLAEQLASGKTVLSNISPAAVELQSLALGSEAPSMATMLEKIERDPNLAAAILRAANSAVYRGMPRVLDLSAAGRRLGSRRLAEVAQMAALRGAFQAPPKSGWSELLSRMWRNTVTTAHTCRLMAERMGFLQRGQAYSMALFHNLGEVIVVDLYKKMGEVAPPGGLALGALRSHMDQHHAALGELLIRSWGLPGSLASLARHHHDPAELPSGTPLSRNTWLVAACFQAVVEAGADYKDRHEEGPPLEVACAALGVSADQVQTAAKDAIAWWSGESVEPVESAARAPSTTTEDKPPATVASVEPGTEAPATSSADEPGEQAAEA